jgi:hypothetical protein
MYISPMFSVWGEVQNNLHILQLILLYCLNNKKKGKEEKRSSHHPNPLFDQLEVIPRPLFIGNYTGVDCCVDSKQGGTIWYLHRSLLSLSLSTGFRSGLHDRFLLEMQCSIVGLFSCMTYHSFFSLIVLIVALVLEYFFVLPGTNLTLLAC